eukprot:14607008-Alexandrium_andersonii.AAC.1
MPPPRCRWQSEGRIGRCNNNAGKAWPAVLAAGPRGQPPPPCNEMSRQPQKQDRVRRVRCLFVGFKDVIAMHTPGEGSLHCAFRSHCTSRPLHQ